ncbi:MAG: flavodoxin [Candidatus Gracilibacteria bacterium]|jgi:flavodoxin
MRKLVVFYSFEGSTKLLAKAIAETIEADILELKPKKETVKSHGFAKYFWGGKQVLFKQKPVLEKFDKNPDDYDVIFLGTPVWSWTYTPAMRSFLES